MRQPRTIWAGQVSPGEPHAGEFKRAVFRASARTSPETTPLDRRSQAKNSAWLTVDLIIAGENGLVIR